MKYTPKNLEKLRTSVAAYRSTAMPREDSGGKHWYPAEYTSPDGKAGCPNYKYPSASAILNTFGVNEYLDAKPEVMEEAAHIGTAVHERLDYICGGKMFSNDPMIIDDVRYQSCIKAFSKFAEDSTQFLSRIVSSELELVSPKLGYGGTVDCIAWIDDKLVLLDYKTGDIQYKNFLQLELYALLVKECLGITVDRVILVQLKKTGGEYKVRECPDRQQSKKFCRHLLKTYQQLESFKRLVDGRRKLNV